MPTARRALATAALLALALATPATAQYCENYTAYLHHLAIADTGGNARDVVVRDGLAYVADRQTGLRIYDVTHPTQPELVGEFAAVGAAGSLATDGATVWITNDQNALHAVDVTDPTAPHLLRSITLPDAGRDLALHGDFLLVAAGTATLRVVDVADRTRPCIVGALDLDDGLAEGVAARGAIACIAHGDGGLRVIDLADPTAPTLLATVAMNSTTTAVDLGSDGNVAHVANFDGDLTLVSLVDPAQPVVLSRVPLPVASNRGIHVDGSITWLAGRTLRSVDTSDPHDPRPLGEVTAFAATHAVHISGATAFVAAGPAGLEIFDAANPASPPPLSTVLTEQSALGLALDENHTYLAANDLFVYDHTDPTAPVLLGSVAIPNTASRVAVTGGFAYVTATASDADNLHVIDVSDANHPVLVASIELPGFLGDILANETVLYVADFLSGGVHVVDITHPTSPVHSHTLATPPYALILAMAGERLYVTTGIVGGAAITVFDVTDPYSPTFLAEVDLDAEAAWGLTVAGTTAYTAIKTQGPSSLRIYDLADPGAPQILGFVELPGVLHGVVLAGSYAHIVAENGQVHAVDVSDPAAPVRLGSIPLPDNCYVIAPGHEVVHAAVTDAGMMILPQHCDVTVGIEARVPEIGGGLAAYPNPFNPRVTVSFSLMRAEKISLDVFDVAGRRVARLAQREFAAGRQEVVWSGCDGAGRALPSGAYYVRLVGEARVRGVKIVLVR